MPESISTFLSLERDGTSQQGRRLPNLAPEAVGIDERRLADWLAFAHAYAKELKYVGLDNEDAGDWSGFLNPTGLVNAELPELWREIERFVDAPERFDDASQHRRPHFVLFLAFLHLLGLSQQRLNRLTQEHLDFYYQKFLALEKQAPRPDRVNILAKLASGAQDALLPKGTLLDAGKDSQGEALHYLTDEDLIVNRAQIKSLYSVFVDKKVTGIREAREDASVNQGDPLLAMFTLVYGDPANEGQLPPYPSGKAFDKGLLDQLSQMAGFVADGLYMDFQELRALLRLKNRRNWTAEQDWSLINGALQNIATAHGNSRFTIQPPNTYDFWDNLIKALNGKPPFFASIPGDVNSLEDLYRQRDGMAETAFIESELKLDKGMFSAMMERKMEVDKDWKVVNELLETAGKRMRKDRDFRLFSGNADNPYRYFSAEFDGNFQAALGNKVDFSPFQTFFSSSDEASDLDRFYAALQQVEAYFYCALEEFVSLIDARKREKEFGAVDWKPAYVILASAFARKVYAGRRKSLSDLRRGETLKDGLEAMLRLALDEPVSAVDGLLERLEIYRPDNQAYVETLARIKAGISDADALSKWEDKDWQAAVEALELAWRKREGTPPVAQKEVWLNLYAETDATRVKPLSQIGTPRWRTFGQGRPAPTKDQPPAPLLGWSIASPALILSQGQRVVMLTLVFQADTFDGGKIDKLLSDSDDSPFLIEASGEKGWLAPSTIAFKSVDYPLESSKPEFKALILTLAFNESAPPLAALPGGESPWPMLRLLLRPLWQDERYVAPYLLFQGLVLERVLIDVEVIGLKDLLLANDAGPLPAGKPFEPFGFSPAAGSAFQFAHPELTIKRLNRLSLNLQWMNVPAGILADHYSNYPYFDAVKKPIESNSIFTVKASLLDNRTGILLAEEEQLFAPKNAAEAGKIMLDIPKTLTQYAPLDLANMASWPRYWRLELNSPDFQHGNYARVAAAKSVELAVAIGTRTPSSPDANKYKVNPPYTPKLKSFRVDYACAVDVVMKPYDQSSYGKGEEKIFHLHAFGMTEIQAENDELYRFLPSYPYEGELYIGLENVAAPQDLAILFQMAEGSADPSLEPPRIEWSYLSGNRWLSLRDGGILADATNGLVQSGIVKFRLPKALPSTLLSSDQYWIRAAVARDADGVCDAIALHAQAVSATWVVRGDVQGHLSRPLPAETIHKTAVPVPGVGGLSQPYTSFGGKPGERDVQFNQRISERLRHKQRALSQWDYERLVLENFPGIYKAKCLSAASNDPADLGKVDVVVIPDIRNHFPFDPFEPKATAGQIAEITDFLAAYVPPMADVKVKNAHYVPIRVRFAVSFMPGADPGFYKVRLNEELNRFLSPWAYEDSVDVAIGGKIYANAIVNFLERRPYVDYVAELKLFKDEDGLGFKLVLDEGDTMGYRVSTDRPDGVLVAHRQHDIDLITDAGFKDAKFTGIGYMKIELDFIVN